MPPHIFKKLNERLLKDKEEIKKALCEAYESMPEPVNYKEKILTFTGVLNALDDPTLTPKIKNQYLKDIIKRIDYERPFTKAPYKINIELKA